MSCRHAAVRQCVRAWLPLPLAPTASPLWVYRTRPCFIVPSANAENRSASTLSLHEPIVKEKKPREKAVAQQIDENITTTKESVIVKRQRTVCRTTITPGKPITSKKSAAALVVAGSLRVPKRPTKHPQSILAVPTVVDAPASRKKVSRSQKLAQKIPPRIEYLARTDKYWNLESFERWTEEHDVRKDTSTYKGTRFEYMCVEVLRSWGFDLQRVGRKHDLGIDLIGRWALPADRQELKVVIQCKASKIAPCMVRELEGTLRNAPPGYNGDNVLGILVSTEQATSGVWDAIQRSRVPMGFINITRDGRPLQFKWNDPADLYLDGLTANMTYGVAKAKNDDGSDVGRHLSLLWMGKPWTAWTAHA